MKEVARKVIKGILRGILAILFRVKIIGEENIPIDGACILCPNHISNWDPLTVVMCTKRPVRMMAKEELYKSRFLRLLAEIFGVFPVKRGKGDIDAIKRSLKVLKDGDLLSLYPEGTRKGVEKGVKPKNGAVLIALKSGTPIIPIGIQGNFKLFRKVKINYGKPIYYNKKEIDSQNKEKINELTKELMDEIIKLRDEKRMKDLRRFDKIGIFIYNSKSFLKQDMVPAFHTQIRGKDYDK